EARSPPLGGDPTHDHRRAAGEPVDEGPVVRAAVVELQGEVLLVTFERGRRQAAALDLHAGEPPRVPERPRQEVRRRGLRRELARSAIWLPEGATTFDLGGDVEGPTPPRHILLCEGPRVQVLHSG